jgi:hypothetical protein
MEVMKPKGKDFEPSSPAAPSEPPAVEPPAVEPPPQRHYNARKGTRRRQGYLPFPSYQPSDDGGHDIVAEAVLERKNRRRYQSNIRADKRRQKVAIIEKKPEYERTDEEKDFLQNVNDQRLRKNQRTKERALEKKAEAGRILALSADDRTDEEEKTLALYLAKIKHKNESDRLRRKRVKQFLQESGHDTCSKPSIAATGSSYREPQLDYMYPPPYPYPPIQPPQHAGAKIEHKNEGDRLHRKRVKQALKESDHDTCSEPAIATAGSAYSEPQRDYRYPPPYPYPPKQPPQHPEAPDRLRRKGMKQALEDDTRSKPVIDAAGSAYLEPQRDYRYPPPYPYPPMQRSPRPLPSTRFRRPALVLNDKNRSKGNLLHCEHSHSPLQAPLNLSLPNQNEPDRYPDGVYAPPSQLQLPPQEHATVPVPAQSYGHSSQVKQNSDKVSSADSIEEKTGGAYIEDLKYPRRGRRRLPEMSDTDIEEREKVRRTLKNERLKEKKERAKDRVTMILRKAEFDRSVEEIMFVERHERNRVQKNARGRERNRQRKEKMEKIRAKPKGERTSEETEWLAFEAKRKRAKNINDRKRRFRIKEAKAKNENKFEILESILAMADLEEYPQELFEDSD